MAQAGLTHEPPRLRPQPPVERDWRAEYARLFHKPAHHRMKVETIRAQVEAYRGDIG